MARAISKASTAPGITTYKLTGHDNFVVVAASWQVDTNSGGTPAYWFDYRDQNGLVIAIQSVGQVDANMPTLVVLSPGNVPAATIDEGSVKLFPTTPGTANNVLVSPIMGAVPLTPYCTINAYVAQILHTGPTPDPIDYLDTGANPNNLHLWVEDTGGVIELPPNPPPLLTHEAVGVAV